MQRRVSRRQQNRLRRQEAKQVRRRGRQYKREQRAEFREQQTTCGSIEIPAQHLTQEARADVDGALAAGVDAESTAPGQSGTTKESNTRAFPQAIAGPSVVVQRHHRKSSSSVSFDAPIHNDSFV